MGSIEDTRRSDRTQPKVRYVVTNRQGRAATIFHRYHQRGQAENSIKELKRDLAADRLSCHAYRANACRLATATLGTVRLRLLKLGARVVRPVRRRCLASGWPGQPVFLAVHRQPCAFAKYFDDMWAHFCELPELLALGAELHYIVGNSTFYGSLVSTERVYAEMLSELGFSRIEYRPIRKRDSKKELIEFDGVAQWE